MKVPNNREIEAWLAEHVAGLTGVGYYRRQSMTNTIWEKCKEDDNGASLYYTTISNRLDSLFSVPCYTTDIAAAFELIEILRHSGYVLIISTIYQETRLYSVLIRGCKRSFESFHSDLVTATDMYPAKAICIAICNLLEQRNENNEHITTT
jgi:hypothetical protein